MNVKLLDTMGRLGPLGLVGAELHPNCTDALKVRLALLEVLLEAGLVLNAGHGGGAEAVGSSDKPSPENNIVLYKKEIRLIVKTDCLQST